MPDPRRLLLPSILLTAALLSGCRTEQERSSNQMAAKDVSEAVAPDQTPEASDIEAQKRELLALERAYSDALIRRDRAFLEAYYAPDWRGGNWLGFWTKATMLKAVLGTRYEVRSMTLSNVQARVVGNIGIVQGVSNEVTRVDGRDTSGRWTFTDVFERRGGRWVAIASHTSELTGQPPKE
nr:nuclear transport factor 2 family protein [uncultured Sphingomonas sp.]